EVLARKPGTSANKMFKENLASHIRIAELEVRISFDYRLIPSNLPLIHEPGQQERGHTLGVGGCHKKRVAIDALRFAQFASAKPTFIDNTTAVQEGKRNPWNFQLLHRSLDEVLQFRDAVGGERDRLPACEGLFVVPLWSQALND